MIQGQGFMDINAGLNLGVVWAQGGDLIRDSFPGARNPKQKESVLAFAQGNLWKSSETLWLLLRIVFTSCVSVLRFCMIDHAKNSSDKASSYNPNFLPAKTKGRPLSSFHTFCSASNFPRCLQKTPLSGSLPGT